MRFNFANKMRSPAEIPLVLVADDDPDDVALVRHALSRTGARNNVVVLADGTAVMNYLQRWLAVSAGDWIARGLLLLDLRMPRTHGIDVLRWIRAQQRLRDLHVLVLTHSEDPREIESARAAGANRCLSKGSAAEIQDAMREALFGTSAAHDVKSGP